MRDVIRTPQTMFDLAFVHRLLPVALIIGCIIATMMLGTCVIRTARLMALFLYQRIQFLSVIWRGVPYMRFGNIDSNVHGNDECGVHVGDKDGVVTSSFHPDARGRLSGGIEQKEPQLLH